MSKAQSQIKKKKDNKFDNSNGGDKVEERPKEKKTKGKDNDKEGQAKGDDVNLEDDEEFHLPDSLPPMNWLEYITLDSTVSIFGKRNTGKTFYARYLMYQLKDYFPWGWCMTNTPQNGFWQSMIPEKRIFKGWRPDVIREIMELQRGRIRRTDVNPYVFVILDDIVSDERLRYDPVLRELYFEGRHFGIFILICSQYVYGLPPGNRANTDFMITFNQQQQRQLKQIQEDYCTEFKNWQSLRKDLQRLLGDHGVLILNQRDPDLRGVERYHMDVADEPPPFYLGTKNYWEGSDWEEQCKKWEPITNRTLEKMKKMKSEMEYKHSIDDSKIIQGTSVDQPLIDRIMDYGGIIPHYF